MMRRKVLMEEREKRKREVEQQQKFMQEQMDALMMMVQEQAKTATPGKGTVTVERDVKFTKLMETDDVEVYLTTFEWTVNAFEVPPEQWVYKLAPQLTRKAQQAFAAIEAAGASNYDEVKAAILPRYNINKETYQQRLTTFGSHWPRLCKFSIIPVSVHVYISIFGRYQVINVPDMLIGSDLYWNVLTGEILRGSGCPIAVNTRLGWVLSGLLALQP